MAKKHLFYEIFCKKNANGIIFFICNKLRFTHDNFIKKIVNACDKGQSRNNILSWLSIMRAKTSAFFHMEFQWMMKIILK